MRTFRINEEIEVVCNTKKTRSGFKHEATLKLNGEECETVKVSYSNRTWESYEYQTVLHKLVEYKDSSLTAEQKEICIEFIKGDQTDWTPFKQTAAIAQLGELFGQSLKEKNDWKLRMIKAGMPEVSLPDDWDSLTEEVKADRLEKILELMKQVGGE